MRIECVEGIILSETNYSESSKILNVFTKEFGLIGVMSKGCRNMKSKLRGVSRKLVYGKFHIYYKEQGLSTLIGVDLINSFAKLVMDLERISYASYLIDLVLQVVKQNDDLAIFELLKSTLLKIEYGLPPMALTNILRVKLLDYLGVQPNIDCCSICGSDKDIVTLSSEQGGYICRNCYHNEIFVSAKTVQMLRMFYYVDINNISKLDVSEMVIKEISQFLDDYYDRYTGIYLKSRDFIRQLNKLTGS